MELIVKINTEIAYKIRKNAVCYTEIQAARLEALLSLAIFLFVQLKNILYRRRSSLGVPGPDPENFVWWG